jgi:hypothetical protein
MRPQLFQTGFVKYVQANQSRRFKRQGRLKAYRTYVDSNRGETGLDCFRASIIDWYAELLVPAALPVLRLACFAAIVNKFAA